MGRNGEIILSDEIGFYKYSPFSRLFNFKRLPIKSSQHGELFNIFKILENQKGMKFILQLSWAMASMY